ncbi:hypothetical protein OGAPHI_005220 [Ogataea philodendri]|uniref:protein disulfide-isomerase n=1 Tax=Ogataea philodendri TaxID=1378263 RepID=A0A9P8P274_9ASCO|nr:uncharacterized protein OGAPHI_005220 [Ogataea philodendri]KAH3663817.1 hypothetical protein OGAPHI_005220 [Ogataea philodendri]
MRFTIFLFIAAVFGSVLELEGSNFNEVVLESGKTTLVKFYASWCSHCKRLEPIWEELAEVYSKRPDVQIVSIDADKHRSVGKKYGVNAFPTLKLFKSSDLQNPIEYEGARSVEAFTNFIVAHTGVKPAGTAPAPVVALHDGNIEQLTEGKDAFISITADWCGHCNNLKPTWDKLAANFAKDSDIVVVGRVQTTDPEATEWIQDKFQVQGFPTLVYIKNGNLDEPEFYQGPRSLSALTEFINENAGTTRSEDGGLHPEAGLLHSLDTLVAKFVGAGKNERVKLAKPLTEAIDQLKTENKYSKEIRYYTKLVNSLVNGPYDFIPKEITRLEKLLTENVSTEAKDSAMFRLNILRFFNSHTTAATYN